MWTKLCGVAAAIAVSAAVSGAPAHAATYVGSWEVDQGPGWWTEPLAYTGVQAATLIFGPPPPGEGYAISTNGPNPATINYEAWYSIFSWGGGTIFSENYVYRNTDPLGNNFCCGLYFNGVFPYSFTPDSPASAYVEDNAIGPYYTNYAFLAQTPLPSSWTMLLIGLAGLGFVAYRRKQNAAPAAA